MRKPSIRPLERWMVSRFFDLDLALDFNLESEVGQLISPEIMSTLVFPSLVLGLLNFLSDSRKSTPGEGEGDGEDGRKSRSLSFPFALLIAL